MEKPIFKKKYQKRTLQSQDQPEKTNLNNYKQQNIVDMSVQDIQNSLINRINMSSNQYQNSNDLNNRQFFNHYSNSSMNTEQIDKSQKRNDYTSGRHNYSQNGTNIKQKQQKQIKYGQIERKSVSSYSNSGTHSSKQIPQLMLENQQMKQEIQNLKKEKKLIIQKYEHALSLSRSIQSQARDSNTANTKPFQKLSKKNDQFSFRKSIDQAQRESSIPNFQKKQFIQDFFQHKVHQYGHKNQESINQKIENSQISKSRQNKIQNPDSVKQSLEATLPVTSSLPSNKNSGINYPSRRSKLGRSIQTRHQNYIQHQRDPQNSKQQIYNPEIGQKLKLNKKEGNSFSLGKNTNLQARSKLNSIRNQVGTKSNLTLQDKFYQYCKNEIVRVNAENAKLNLRLGELQNKLTTLLKENQNLKFVNQHLVSSNSTTEATLQEYKGRLQKLSIQFQKTNQSQKQNHTKEINRLQKELFQYAIQKKTLKQSLLQKDNQIIKLKSQVKQKQLKCQNLKQISQHKAFLQMQLNESISRNKKLREKYIKSSAIDHLWQIKEVQFAGIIELLQKGRLSQ